jgi:hypothetical protein
MFKNKSNNQSRMTIPENHIEDIATSFLWFANAFVVERRVIWLPVEDASVHALIDTWARGRDYRGAHGSVSLGGLCVDAIWRVISRNREVGRSYIRFMTTPRLEFLPQRLLRALDSVNIVSRLDNRVGIIFSISRVVSNGECQVSMAEDCYDD